MNTPRPFPFPFLFADSRTDAKELWGILPLPPFLLREKLEDDKGDPLLFFYFDKG